LRENGIGVEKQNILEGNWDDRQCYARPP